MPHAVSADDVRTFWAQMSARYGTRLIPKQRAWEMKAAARLLDALGIMPHETFMSEYTTVWGRRIYPCFTPGEAPNEDALFGQIIVCVHEHQHVEQAMREGFVSYSTRYLTSSRARALYEAEAYGCNMELVWARSGRLLSPDTLSQKLLAYGCTRGDVLAARAYFERLVLRLQRGGYQSSAVASARQLLPWLP